MTAKKRRLKMSNRQFLAWRLRNFKNRQKCSEYMELGDQIIRRLETGVGRNGQSYPVPKHVAVACGAYELGLREYNGVEMKMADDD